MDIRCMRGWIFRAEFHSILIVINGIVDATHHTLIISKEEDGQASHTVDGYEKATLFIPVHHIPLRDLVHDGYCSPVQARYCFERGPTAGDIMWGAGYCNGEFFLLTMGGGEGKGRDGEREIRGHR